MSGHAYLASLLDQQRVPDTSVARMQQARDDIEGKLRPYIGYRTRFYYGGSYGKKTMIKEAYDLDLATYFPTDDNRSVKQLYELVEGALKTTGFTVKRKNVALNLPYSAGFYIDVVPARGRDEAFRYATLYKNEIDSYMQTSLKVHIESVAPFRDIIKLMKLWKARYSISCKTFVIELLVIRALGASSINDYSDAFLRVLRFIDTNISTVRLVDPANSNNIVEIDDATRRLLQHVAHSCLQRQHWGQIVW